MKIVNESYPSRCEICHKSDCFNTKQNYCFRCIKVDPIVNLSKYEWHFHIYYYMFISIISIIVSSILFMGIILFYRNRIIPVKILTQEEVTKLAEQYIIDNGYTDQPKWKIISKHYILNSQLTYNYNIDGYSTDNVKVNVDKILNNRFNMVAKESCFTTYDYSYNSRIVNWKIYFKGTSSDECTSDGLEVIMDLSGHNIKVRKSPPHIRFSKSYKSID